MATDTALMRTSAVDPEVAAAIRVYEQLEPLKNALGIDGLSVPEMQLFAMVAHRTGLDPFTRQIYAIKRGGKVTHQTGIDGYRSVAERTKEYAGSDEPSYEPCACGSSESPAEHPAVARVTVHRILPSGHVVDQVGVARWHELKPDHRKPQNAYDFLDSMWWKMPFNQLAKCAEANALRKAFPRVLEGVYVTEEMEQAGPPQNTELAAAAARPTSAERIAARRAAVEQTREPVIVEPLGRPIADELPLDDDDPGPAPEIRPQGAPAPASASTSASPAAAAARPVAAAPAPDSGPPARPDALLTAMAAPLTFEQFQDEIERHAEVTHDDVVMAARIRFPGTKYISKLDDDQRGRLLVEAITQAEARMAAAASA